jgi:hypothetical protein
MSCTAIGSTPANGSSRSMNFGSPTSARVISSRRRSPPEREYAYDFLTCLMLSSSSSASSRRFCSARGMPSVCRIAMTFCSTVSLRKMEGSCARYPIPARARRYMGTPVSFRSPM